MSARNLLVAASLTLALTARADVYVSPAGSGNKDGTSAADAYDVTQLQIACTEAGSAEEKTVRLAGGVYYTTEDEGITVPEGVTSIGECAFFGCSALEQFNVPASVTSIGNYFLRGCSSLTKLTVSKDNPNCKSVNNCIVSASGTTLIAIPYGCAEVVIPDGVSDIPEEMFYEDYALTKVTIPSSVTSIGKLCFFYCSSLTSVTIPASVTSVGSSAFSVCSKLSSVTFLGKPPTGVEKLLSKRNVSFPRSSGGAWMKLLNDINMFQGYNRKQPAVAVLSSKIRENDPTILDAVYKVTSSVTNTVKVRALAFEDGIRSFANVVTEGDLLPLEVRTIPASDQYGKMDVTWNAITEDQWFDVLLWLYADKNLKVTLSDGVYYYDGKVAAKDAAIYYNMTASSYYSQTYDSAAKKYVYVRYKNAPEVVMEEMGYALLSGEVMNYVNEETRLGLSPSGARQYGYKIVSGEK